jgi:16S rRNA (guanine(966)-N(2))-methyltransferase RsmD
LRIISGEHKGILINPPKGLPVRPTTDRAKESLFNILENSFDLSILSVLDIFSGTGNIAYEFASRGAQKITAVDSNEKCIAYIKSVKEKLEIKQLVAIKKDAFGFLKSTIESYDIIFADAPYAHKQLIEIPRIVKQKGLLKEDGWLILEHESLLDLDTEPGFFDKRMYGQSAFSFFKS